MSFSRNYLRYGLLAHVLVLGWGDHALSQQQQQVQQQPVRVALIVPGPLPAGMLEQQQQPQQQPIRVAMLVPGPVPTAMLGQAAAAAPVPAPTTTIWNRLGIPQAFNNAQDSMLNSSGDNPGAERVDPLLRLADPNNLNSPNPAIKKAAQIKADQDKCKQKVKAIKYLATVGCGCYPGVSEALLASLDDCTEAVRFEAATALYKVAGNPCQRCGSNGCCNAAVMNKLQDVATGQDAQGCYKENSQRVRQMAQYALDACRRKHPVSPTPPPQVVPSPTTPVRPPVKVEHGPVPTPAPAKPDLLAPPSEPAPLPPTTKRATWQPRPAPLPLASQQAAVREPMPAPLPPPSTRTAVEPMLAPLPPPSRQPAVEPSPAPQLSEGKVEMKVLSISGESHPQGAKQQASVEPKAEATADATIKTDPASTQTVKIIGFSEGQ